MEYLDKAIDFLGLKNIADKIPQLKKIEEKTGQKPQYILLAVILIFTLILLCTSFGHLIIMLLLNFLYPLYKSYKVLESRENLETKKWLVYWTTLGFIFAFKSYLLIFFYFIPFFELIVILGLTCVYLPIFEGHIFVYDKIIKPTLCLYENKVIKYVQMACDETMNRMNCEKKQK